MVDSNSWYWWLIMVDLQVVCSGSVTGCASRLGKQWFQFRKGQKHVNENSKTSLFQSNPNFACGPNVGPLVLLRPLRPRKGKAARSVGVLFQNLTPFVPVDSSEGASQQQDERSHHQTITKQTDSVCEGHSEMTSPSYWRSCCRFPHCSHPHCEGVNIFCTHMTLVIGIEQTVEMREGPRLQLAFEGHSVLASFISFSITGSWTWKITMRCGFDGAMPETLARTWSETRSRSCGSAAILHSTRMGHDGLNRSSQAIGFVWLL